MFCKFCGKQIEDDALFCDGCGAKLKNSQNGNSEAPVPVAGENVVNAQDNTGEQFSVAQPELPDKKARIVKRVCFVGMILAIIGVALAFINILAPLSIALSVIGIAAIIAKFCFFKMGTLPAALWKKILLIVLALLCVVSLFWGIADLNRASSSSYDENSSETSAEEEIKAKAKRRADTEYRLNYEVSSVSIQVTSAVQSGGGWKIYGKVNARDRFGDNYTANWTITYDANGEMTASNFPTPRKSG